MKASNFNRNSYMAKNVPIEGRDDDYIYSIPESATIIGKSVKTLWTYYPDGIQKKDKLYNGRTQTFISAKSIREFARRHPDKVRIDFESLEKYTPDEFKEVISTFRTIYPSSQEVVIPNESKGNSNPTVPREIDDRLYDFMEKELEKSQQEILRMNSEIQRLNDQRVESEQKHSGEVERLSKEAGQASVQLADLRGKYKILSLRYNQDIRRVREGSLNPKEVVLIPEMTDNGDLQMPQDAQYQEQPQSSIFDAITENAQTPVKDKIIIDQEPEESLIEEEESILREPAKSKEDDQEEKTEKPKKKRGLFNWFGSK